MKRETSTHREEEETATEGYNNCAHNDGGKRINMD